jgi:hypothetical protein
MGNFEAENASSLVPKTFARSFVDNQRKGSETDSGPPKRKMRRPPWDACFAIRFPDSGPATYDLAPTGSISRRCSTHARAGNYDFHLKSFIIA